MVVERASGETYLLEVLDRVLDKGIVIDAWVRFSLAGIDLMTVEAHVVVASFATYRTHAEKLAGLELAGAPISMLRETLIPVTIPAKPRPIRLVRSKAG
jgi:hypothetical protein